MLKRRFSPLNLLFLSINGMIGSAWLFAPLYGAKIAGSAAISAWLIAGMGTALIAFTFAELSVMFPWAGGTARIPELSHGLLTSFIVSWVAWLSALTMAPIEVQAILQYASMYFDSLTYLKEGVPVLTGFGYVWAIILMLLMCVINSASAKGLVGFNLVLFIFKMAVIVATIYMLINTHFAKQNFSDYFSQHFSWTGWQAILSAIATGGIAFAFTGFKHGVELAGEAKNSARAIPLAIVGSVFVCLVLYMGLQIAFIGALRPEQLALGWSQLNFVGEIGPFAGIAAALGLIWLMKFLLVDAVISPGGAGLIYVTSTARILYAMSQMGFVPRWMSKLNRSNFPVAAIMVNFILGMFLFLPLPGWQAMVSFLVSGMVLSYGIGPIALLSLRSLIPSQQRSFRLPYAYLVCPLAFYLCNLLSYWTGFETVYKLAIALAIGGLFFIYAMCRGQLPTEKLGLESAFWLFPYLGGLTGISYLGAFGGINFIPFGWDFLVIAIFSAGIMYLAQKNRAKVCDLKQLNPPLIEASYF